MTELFFATCEVGDFLDRAKRDLFASHLPEARAARIKSRRTDRAAAERAAAEQAFRRVLQEAGETYSSVPVGYTDTGKPYLIGRDDLSVSFTHSGGLSAAVLLKNRGGVAPAVGLDMEEFRPLPPHGFAAANRFLPPILLAQLSAAPADTREEVFFRLWTQTEATVKMSGVGLGNAATEQPVPAESCVDRRTVTDACGRRYAVCLVFSSPLS